MDNSVFQEAWSLYLGTASPACANWVGLRFKPVRGKWRKVDAMGDDVRRSHVRGDGWRTRHDSLKWAIVSQADYCQYKLHVEPDNIFLPFIRQRQSFMAENVVRKRQGLVPDLYDVDHNTLMDIKGFSWGSLYRPIRFHRARVCGAVNKRAQEVHTEYDKKARKIDVQYNAWLGPEPGPVERKLAQFGRVEGLAVGVHGEGSDDLLKLLDRISERGAVRRFHQLGFSSAKRALPVIKRYTTMVVGIEALRGTARLTLTNLSSILAGSTSARMAASRRRAARMRYTAMGDMYWAAHCHFDD